MRAKLEVFERQDKRIMNLSIEYLKNIILSFLDANSDKEKLVPIIAQVLYLSHDEVEKLKKSFEYTGITGAMTGVLSGFGMF